MAPQGGIEHALDLRDGERLRDDRHRSSDLRESARCRRRAQHHREVMHLRIRVQPLRSVAAPAIRQVVVQDDERRLAIVERAIHLPKRAARPRNPPGVLRHVGQQAECSEIVLHHDHHRRPFVPRLARSRLSNQA